jgi:hypothetical protein
MNGLLEQFIQQLDTQDTACTAKPVIIELQEKERIYVPTDHNHDGSARAKDCDLGESPEDLGLDPEETLYWRDVWVGRQWFLTRAGYDQHVRLNRHNYRKEIRPYVRHAFRNPEIEQVIGWLIELAAIKRHQAQPLDENELVCLRAENEELRDRADHFHRLYDATVREAEDLRVKLVCAENISKGVK